MFYISLQVLQPLEKSRQQITGQDEAHHFLIASLLRLKSTPYGSCEHERRGVIITCVCVNPGNGNKPGVESEAHTHTQTK